MDREQPHALIGADLARVGDGGSWRARARNRSATTSPRSRHWRTRPARDPDSTTARCSCSAGGNCCTTKPRLGEDAGLARIGRRGGVWDGRATWLRPATASSAAGIARCWHACSTVLTAPAQAALGKDYVDAGRSAVRGRGLAAGDAAADEPAAAQVRGTGMRCSRMRRRKSATRWRRTDCWRKAQLGERTTRAHPPSVVDGAAGCR